MKRQQQGFLMVLALAVITIFALLSAALVSMFNSTSMITAYLQATKEASFLAESALEQGRSNLTQPTISSRQTCAALSNTTSVGSGNAIVAKATDTANSTNPRYAFATLTTAFTSASTPTTITVNDSSVFAPYGRVLIGGEVFAYEQISNSTTLDNVTRAQDSSTATSHVIGEYVSQYQCTISGSGNQPATSPMGIRQYQQDIQQPVLFVPGATGTLLRWNSETSELAWQSLTSGTTLNLNDVSALNYHDAWAVGDSASNDVSSFSRLQGNTWTFFTHTNTNKSANLKGVFSTSSVEAWAVGDRAGGGGSATLNILRWTRNSTNTNDNWCPLTTSSGCGGVSFSTTGVTGATQNLTSVKTRDTNGDGNADAGYAAGGQSGTNGGGVSSSNRGIVMSFNGTQWANLAITADSNVGIINGLDMTANGTTEAFFVAQRANSATTGILVRLRSGPTWTFVNTTNVMNAVSVIDTNGDGLADFGCAVGNGGQAIVFDSSMATTSFTLTGAPQLNGVIVLSPTDVWAIGNGGVRFHYDGTSWVSITTGVTTSSNLAGISAVFPKTSPTSAWYDVIN